MKIKLSKKLFVFVLVGGISAVIYVVAVSLFVMLGGIEPKLASVFAYCVVLPLSFFGHRIHTFGSVGEVLPEVGRFAVTHLVGVGIMVTSMYVAVSVVSSPFWVGSLAGSVLVPLMNFLVFNYWVFQKQTPV